MRKLCFLFLVSSIILLAIAPLFAQGSRDGTPSEGKTTFTNIAVVGLNNDGTNGSTLTGTPSYIEMINGKGTRYYLFVDSLGALRIGSDTKVGYLASPAMVGWSDASGTVVGAQTISGS